MDLVYVPVRYTWTLQVSCPGTEIRITSQLLHSLYSIAVKPVICHRRLNVLLYVLHCILLQWSQSSVTVDSTSCYMCYIVFYCSEASHLSPSTQRPVICATLYSIAVKPVICHRRLNVLLYVLHCILLQWSQSSVTVDSTSCYMCYIVFYCSEASHLSPSTQRPVICVTLYSIAVKPVICHRRLNVLLYVLHCILLQWSQSSVTVDSTSCYMCYIVFYCSEASHLSPSTQCPVIYATLYSIAVKPVICHRRLNVLLYMLHCILLQWSQSSVTDDSTSCYMCYIVFYCSEAGRLSPTTQRPTICATLYSIAVKQVICHRRLNVLLYVLHCILLQWSQSSVTVDSTSCYMCYIVFYCSEASHLSPSTQRPVICATLYSIAVKPVICHRRLNILLYVLHSILLQWSQSSVTVDSTSCYMCYIVFYCSEASHLSPTTQRPVICATSRSTVARCHPLIGRSACCTLLLSHGRWTLRHIHQALPCRQVCLC